MNKSQKKGIIIPKKIIEETTRKYIDNLTYRKKGFRLMLHNMGLRQHAQELKKGEATKTNIVTDIAVEIIKKYGIDPNTQKDAYNKIRLKVRSEIILFIKGNSKMEKKFYDAVKKFQKFERIGNTKIGKAINKIAKKTVKIRQKMKRNLRVK